MTVFLILSIALIITGILLIVTNKKEKGRSQVVWGQTILFTGLLLLVMTSFSIIFFNNYPYDYFIY